MEEKLRNFLKVIKLNESTVSMVLGVLVVVVVGALIVNYFRLKPAQLPQVSQESAQTQDIAGSEEYANTPATELPPFTGELPTTYKVRAGDNLWQISERFYQTGFAWVEIAAANNLSSEGDVEKDQQLTIPQLAKAYPLTVETSEPAVGGTATSSAVDQPTATPTVIPTQTLTPTPTVKPTLTSTPTLIPTLDQATSQGDESQQVKPQNRFGEQIFGTNYTVVKGDHLWGIATRAYNDGYKWTEIAELNKLENPNLIHPGLHLTLPR